MIVDLLFKCQTGQGLGQGMPFGRVEDKELELVGKEETQPEGGQGGRKE